VGYAQRPGVGCGDALRQGKVPQAVLLADEEVKGDATEGGTAPLAGSAASDALTPSTASPPTASSSSANRAHRMVAPMGETVPLAGSAASVTLSPATYPLPLPLIPVPFRATGTLCVPNTVCLLFPRVFESDTRYRAHLVAATSGAGGFVGTIKAVKQPLRGLGIGFSPCKNLSFPEGVGLSGKARSVAFLDSFKKRVFNGELSGRWVVHTADKTGVGVHCVGLRLLSGQPLRILDPAQERELPFTTLSLGSLGIAGILQCFRIDFQ
jgi:hypothetical protein